MGTKTDRTIASYTGQRQDVISMIEEAPKRVLDGGCSDGSLGAAVMDVFGINDVHGIEYDPDFVDLARSKLATVMQADLNHFNTDDLPTDVDLFVFADVLEHTMQPTAILKKS